MRASKGVLGILLKACSYATGVWRDHVPGGILATQITGDDMSKTFLILISFILGAVIAMTYDTERQATKETLQGMDAYLDKYEKPDITRKCSHEITMVKNGDGFWEVEKPKDSLSTGKAWIKCK
jgi:hypothetical protein